MLSYSYQKGFWLRYKENVKDDSEWGEDRERSQTLVWLCSKAAPPKQTSFSCSTMEIIACPLF